MPGSSGPDQEMVFEGPRLALEPLLHQLIERAGDVLAAQDRLRALLAANNSITGKLTLETVLRAIVEAAREVAHARYAALGVLTPDGRALAEFITVGIDEQAAAVIGARPTGKGLLGAIIDEPHPLRLRHFTDDSRAVGLPPNHPSMTSFLGVPLRARDAIFGNLYLADAESGEFSADDEELIQAFAATAGVAIDNARLFERAQQRERWLEASTDITRQLLSTTGEDPLELIARRMRALAEADLVTVVLPARDPSRLFVEVAAGTGEDDIRGYSYPVAESIVGQVFDSRQPVLIDDVERQERVVHQSQVLPVGPLLAVPLVGDEVLRGALVVGRRHGRPQFDATDVATATMFANHAALALELADARADQQRVVLIEDRERIGRDLHDQVIQRLFAAGMRIQTVAAGLPRQTDVEHLESIVGDLDKTVSQIRTTIFRLSGGVAAGLGQVRGAILAVVDEMVPILGFQPAVLFQGAIEALVPDMLLDDVSAVIREALSNVARHARARTVEVLIDADPTRLRVSISDDGIGLGTNTRRSGLANLRARAERLGGSATATVADPTNPAGRPGTVVIWVVPLAQ